MGQAMGNQSIDIIIPTHNKLGLTIQCLDALYANTEVPFRVTIIDDSTDLTPQYLKELNKENMTVIRPEEKLVHGNQIINIGLRNTTSDLVVYMGNNVRVEPQWINMAIPIFNNPKVAIVGFKLLLSQGTIEHAGMRWTPDMPHHMNYGVGEAGHRFTFISEVQLVGWALVMLRRSAFPEPLDTTTFLGFRGYDDVDNCMEAWKRGWTVVYNGLGSAYHASLATRGNNSREFLEECEENRRRFLRKWGGTPDNINRDIVGMA